MVFRVNAKTLTKVFQALPCPVPSRPFLTSLHTFLSSHLQRPSIPLGKASPPSGLRGSMGNGCLDTSLTSPLPFTPAHCTPAILASLRVLKCPNHTSASGALHSLLSLL